MSKKTQRRHFIKLATGGIISSAAVPAFLRFQNVHANQAQELLSTPAQTEGPFYPVSDQADKDTDLTQIVGESKSALGERIKVAGRVSDQAGRAINSAQVEIWQANAAGRYQHIRDRNQAPIDPHFQGWGISRSSAKGNYQFTSILPGVYPAAADWYRPPHIHFKVVKAGYHSLTTQMYFPDQELNKSDLILNSLSDRQLPLLIAKRATAGEVDESERLSIQTFVFDIVLRVRT